MIQLGDLKVQIKLKQLQLNDLYKGYTFKFAAKHTSASHLNFTNEISQEIKKSETFDQKLFNIQSTCNKINEYIIQPDQIFSFWNIVGNPNRSLKRSRSIVNGQIRNETGGGICQVAGIIYHISILSGLGIMERHHHSIDLYTDETRFTPLGTDAAVVYGYKDLRIINRFSFAIQYELKVKDNYLYVRLLSEEPISMKKLHIQEISGNYYKTILVMNDSGDFINESMYKVLH